MSIFTIPREPGALEKLTEGFTKGAQISLPQVLKDISERQKLEQFGKLYQQVTGQSLGGGQPTADGGQPLAQGQQNMAGMGGQQAQGQDFFSTIASNPMLAAAAKNLGFSDIVKTGAEQGYKQQKLGMEERKLGLEATKNFRERVSEDYDASRENLMRLKRMEYLNKNNELTSPGVATTLDKLGLPIGILNNPDSEEFDKLSKDQLKSIRTYFGARINQVEVENFLKTIPTLMNSKEGRNRVIDNLKILAEAKTATYKEYRDFRKTLKRGEALPEDLEDIVKDRTEKRLDKLAEDFVKGSQHGQQIATKPQQIKDFVIMLDPKGQRRRVSKKDAKAAKKAGYRVSK